MNNKYERSIFLSDIHAPFQDNLALSTALGFVRYYKPKYIFILGDLMDMYTLSKFSRDPERKNSLQKELDTAEGILERIRKAAPLAVIFYIKGNHEYRLTKYLWDKAEELSGLRALRLETLLNFAKHKIKYVESGSMLFHDFLIKHGNVVRSRSGYTATSELEKNGCSGLSAHTHRLGQVFKRNYGGLFTWVEAGCLCDLNPEYMEGQVVDWEQGIAYGIFEKGKFGNRFNVSPLPIIRGRIIFDGKEITA